MGGGCRASLCAASWRSDAPSGIWPSVVTVALVGPDGAGKSSISRLLEERNLGRPVKTIYMGVNLDASTMMLPTTRVAMAVKRRRGGRPDMTMRVAEAQVEQRWRDGAARDLKDALRLSLWLAEEWFRQAVALRWARGGAIVIFDRHFLADYASTSNDSPRRWPARVHETLLRRAYPKPGLVICLDAPGTVLHARKGEATPEWLEQRRSHYLRIADIVPRFEIVDVDRPLPDVVDDVARLITEFAEERVP